MLGGVHGKDEIKVYYKELCHVIEEWIEIYEQDGDKLPPATAKKEYSGKFNLRLGRDLHEQIAITAIKRGQSLNKICVDAIKKEIGFYYLNLDNLVKSRHLGESRGLEPMQLPEKTGFRPSPVYVQARTGRPE